MSLIENKSNQSSDDWGVVIQSVPSKSKKDILKQLEKVFQLDKRDAEQILGNMPLILIEGLSFGLAARIKKYFQGLGAVSETTNHDMIKKNCFQVVWPQTPDLSFFLREETPVSEVPAVEKPIPGSPKEVTTAPESPDSEKPAPEEIAEVASPEEKPESQPAEVEMPRILEEALAEEPVSETPAIDLTSRPAADERFAPSFKPAVDPDWERRAKDLNDKIKRIQDEKQQIHAQHAEAAEKVKDEYQQRIEQEKQKSEEIAKSLEDLRKKAEKHEELTKEGEAWRVKATSLEERVRELESDLMSRNASIDELTQEKISKTEALARAQEGLSEMEKNIAAVTRDLSEARGRISEMEDNLSGAEKELAALRDREQGLLQKAGVLERNIQETGDSLRARDEVLAKFEKQVLELAGRVAEDESMRREHAQFVQERASIRKEYEVKLGEQEVRVAKIEDEHRRYRSRTDRKNAAATRELGESVRVVDAVRQGLQKLILFLGSESAVLDTEKKVNLKSPLTRGPAATTPEKS